MRGSKRFSAGFGWAIASLGCMAAVICALDRGILVGLRLEIQSRKDFVAAKIINDRSVRCRYLHLSGIVEREFRDDGNLAPCGLFGSN